MSTKFFNNTTEHTLFDKFKGIAQEMTNFYSFHAVVGFFRSSGYFKLREELKDVSKIQILVGINIDNIFRKHNQAMLMLGNEEEAKEIYGQDFIDDVRNSSYSADVESGILQLCEDLTTGKVEMKIHAQKNLHAKFYLCLPKNHTSNSDGWVIMGSSNISDSGLGLTQSPRYELNVAMKDFDDVAFCKDEFDRLWEEAIPITAQDVDKSKKKTHLGINPTPYELYIKVLIDSFGDQVEDDFSINLPDGIQELKYQKDAVIQGYQMLLDHNGFFLADVVGLGKTIVATMIAKRFIEANGKNTNVLVIYPPGLESNWKETFKLFGITKKTQFISNGSLSKIIDGKDNYKDKEEFDVVIVDEAHGFRSDTSNRYDDLQRICKSHRCNEGLMKGGQKKVMLLSATPLNNRPSDLLNLILLFQDARRCTIEGINNLQGFFAPLIDRYNHIMSKRNTLVSTAEVDVIYEEIRNKVLDKITVRRTRHNIWNDPYYKKDLDAQHIKFPDILPPNDLTYSLDSSLSGLFYSTLKVLTGDNDRDKDKKDDYKDHLSYARYRAVEYLNEEMSNKYKNAARVGENLAGIYRVHMVKRLESSFYAFKRSLETFLRITEQMIDMFDEGKVIVAPEINVKDLQGKGWEIDKIIEYAVTKGYEKSDIVYKPEDFKEEFKPLLIADKEKLMALQKLWSAVNVDPKLDLFVKELNNTLFNKSINPTGKLVIFSESVDTVNYLEESLKKRLSRKDILKVSSSNRSLQAETIRKCFDANYSNASDEYNIVITSDVLAEGVNLHRANVIVNYDSPWNATRLMQRIGRVNRIGSVAGAIHNYMFYPSAEGDAQIQLYKNALIKLQGFHSALGEDAQIYSKEEIVKDFQLYNPKVRDKVDKQLELLREVRELYNDDRALYKKIKALPIKSRTARNVKNGVSSNTTIAIISSSIKTDYYKIIGDKIETIDFLDAAAILKAPKEEQSADFDLVVDIHFAQVKKAMNKFQSEEINLKDSSSITQELKSKDRSTAQAQTFLRNYLTVSDDQDIKQQCRVLLSYVQDGIYSQLSKTLRIISQKYKSDKRIMKENEFEIDKQISVLYSKYYTAQASENTEEIIDPSIVISETFI